MNIYKYIKMAFILGAIYANINSINLPSRFKVCGAYCGPGWCNNMWLDENICDTSAKPEHHILTGYSCTDSCCKIHDKCCGQNKTLQINCNTEIVDCLSHCNYLSLTCSNGKIPVLSGEIELVMDIVKDWCCGSPCV
jgi:hypothetical protein